MHQVPVGWECNIAACPLQPTAAQPNGHTASPAAMPLALSCCLAPACPCRSLPIPQFQCAPAEKEPPPPSRYCSTVMATEPLTSRQPPWRQWGSEQQHGACVSEGYAACSRGG